MSNSKKKKMEKERMRKLRFRKKMEKVGFVVVTVSILLVVGVHYAGTSSNGSHQQSNSSGQTLDDFTVTLISGGSITTKSLEGHPLVVLLMTTCCSSCADASQLLASEYYQTFRSDGIRLLQIENYNDLNENGMSLTDFVSQYGGSNEPGWYIGTAPHSVTLQYNPLGELDVYYLVNSQGQIVGNGQSLGSNLNSVIETLG